jgi:hypothetical protein
VDYLNKVFNTFFVLFALSAPALCPAIRHGQAATKIRRRHRQRSHAGHLYERHQRERDMAGLRHEICPTTHHPRNPRGEERRRSSVQRMSEEQCPLTDRAYWKPFDRFLQRQAPKGWTIKAIYEPADPCEVRPARYEITTDDGLIAIVERSGSISEGWMAVVRDTGIADEFIISTPDGRTVFFHTCWNP